MLPARTRPFSRGRAFRARFRKPNARSGTQPEPRLRILLFFFETSHPIDARNGWKISSFRKLEIEPNTFFRCTCKSRRTVCRYGFCVRLDFCNICNTDFDSKGILIRNRFNTLAKSQLILA